MGREVDRLVGSDYGGWIFAGYGDQVDDTGMQGTDYLSLSLGGAPTGLTLDTTDLIAGRAVTIGGGVIRNMEVLVHLRGSEFADTLSLATQTVQMTVNAGAGDDTIYAFNSSIV
ncbi:MAG: hemolysin-type calcium-binding repeat family protein, partial [Caulobacteraceae bacterium]|nr:hemolysin-type calcium-binding repeat family protein [Caulobacteraceae bacterium]